LLMTRWLLVPLVAASMLVAVLGHAADRPSLDWLSYDATALQSYAVTTNPADPARQTVTPTWAGASAKPYHVLLLVPIKSTDAYSISVNTILSVFHDHAVPAQFELWFYDKQPGIADEALAWAEATHVDLIMTVGSLATDYVHKHFRGHAIPVVTSA